MPAPSSEAGWIVAVVSHLLSVTGETKMWETRRPPLDLWPSVWLALQACIAVSFIFCCLRA